MTRLERLHERLAPLRAELLAHPLHAALTDLRAFRVFMAHHVFAVWDFMSLLKALQARFTCVATPWLPPWDARACRLLNEIVLAEESDADDRGGHASHFTMYRRAMEGCGADTRPIDRFVERLRAGEKVERALEEAPPGARGFVRQTFAFIESGDACAIASAFAFGREELLPDLFRQLVERVDRETGELAELRYYLDRHIEVDGEEHGPMAAKLVELACDDEAGWMRAERAAVASLEARRALWDGVLAAIRG